MQIKLLPVLVFLIVPGLTLTQEIDDEKISLNGYISNMQSVIFEDVNGEWITDNLFHNRINAYYYPSENITFSVQFRNRFMYGETIKYSPGYAETIDTDNGFIDLSMNILNENSFFLNTTIDRIYMQFTKGKFVTTIGRQRINWGISTVWNPNDIFNIQNYFDFDYIEKPGSDAVRFQYYTGPSSIMEVAAKLDRNDHLTLAAYYKFNRGGYDIQLLGGVLEEKDYLAGMGWSGNIKNAGFKGELSYFHPVKNSSDTAGTFLFSMGMDYMFRNSLFVQVEGLYSRMPDGFNINDFLNWYQGTLNVKNLAFTDFSFFSSITYPFSPLLNGSLAGMYFPELKGFFAGPSIDYSVSDNIQLSIIIQVFSGELPNPLTQLKERNDLYLGFLRYKFSF